MFDVGMRILIFEPCFDSTVFFTDVYTMKLCFLSLGLNFLDLGFLLPFFFPNKIHLFPAVKVQTSPAHHITRL